MTLLDIFKAEVLRFRGWALAFFAVHLAVLAFLGRVVDLAQQPLSIYQAFAAVYLACGVLLGAYQMGQYRKPNAWLNLLHRPIPHRRLALALMAAAAALLAIGVLAPLALAALWQDTMTPRVLDHRHLGLVASGWLLAVCGYLMGAFALLANRRYAVAGFVFLALFGNAAVHGLGALALQLAAAAVLGAMVLASFKPDLAAPPRSVLATVAVAGPLAMAMWFALVLGGFGFELLWIMQGSHPNNPPVLIPGSAKEADNAEGRDLLVAGLHESRDPHAALWAEQARISDVQGTGPSLSDLPVHHQFTNPAPLEFDDDERHVRWVFSHDDRRFHGYSIADQRPAGRLGIRGDAPFAHPPLPVGKDLLVARDAVYQFDAEAARVLPRARVPNGEEVVGLDEAGERIALLTQRALYLYDARDLQTGDGELAPRLRVPMPDRVGRLARVDFMELVDGVLVSFTYTRNVYRGEGAPYQVMLRVDEQGRSQRVAERALSSGYGPLYTNSTWWFSPVLWQVQRGLTRWTNAYQPEFDLQMPPRPLHVKLFAAALLLVSLVLAAWRVRRTALPMPARGAWVLLCGLLGLPALMALWLLYPPREQLPRPSRAAGVPATG
jgi:hypothetical protein